jgi:alginate O-acetyltransferase complex protein AlgI
MRNSFRYNSRLNLDTLRQPSHSQRPPYHQFPAWPIMLFSAPEFIFLFLPAIIVAILVLQRLRLPVLTKVTILASSFCFYGWWNYKYIGLLALSILINFLLGTLLTGSNPRPLFRKKHVLILGLIFNIGLLSYFKYTNFLLVNLNHLFNTSFTTFSIVLPLAISFFTFQQISFLIDCYWKRVANLDLLDYSIFVAFFPQLIAGPIVRLVEVENQIRNLGKARISFSNINLGLFVFFIGLFKKTVIADYWARYSDLGFSSEQQLNFFEAWTTSIAFSFQLYFDFSAYSDMAVGLAAILGITIPWNFLSPYKARNIREFWQRWHITLNNFLTNYLFFPLVGRNRSQNAIFRTILITFLISGLWHGAGWTFILWGLMHGLAICVYQLWNKNGVRLHLIISWTITFLFINIANSMFRSPDVSYFWMIIKGMAGAGGLVLPHYLGWQFPALNGVTDFLGITYGNWLAALGWLDSKTLAAAMVGSFLVVLSFPNTKLLMQRFRPNIFFGLFLATVVALSLLDIFEPVRFLYYQF